MNLDKVALLVMLLVVLRPVAGSDIPQPGKHFPKAYYDRLKSDPSAFKFQNGFLKLTAKAQEGRDRIRNGAAPLGILAEVSGHKSILILLVQFSDTQTDPFENSVLASELFGKDGSGHDLPGTLRDYYRENSYGKLLIDGAVSPWKRLAHNQAYYQGADYIGSDGTNTPCYGLCRQNSKVAELVEEAVRLNDDAGLWGQYDNDGPDDKPNTADDDGKVDFVVIVHPGKGAECEDGTGTGLWSHQDLLTRWHHSAYSTKTKSNSKSGGQIQVNDYVLVPAVACDGTTPIQIGVIAHEFGHSLGLPDLYDTSQDPKSEGLGNWDLMAGGAWGGDGRSPQMPVHMSAWSKAYLGWVKPKDVNADLLAASLNTYETEGDVYLLTIQSSATAANTYYLISNRQRVGFDARLPGTGLFVLRVNEGVLKEGLKSNGVNTDPLNLGVAVIEADGLEKLVHHQPDDNFRGGPDDTFPGGSDKRIFDNSTIPKSTGSIALCDIGGTSATMKFGMFVSRGTCPGSPQTGTPQSISLEDLSNAPQKFSNTSIRVRGLLKNEVSNYFREEPKLVLYDDEGHAVPISPWLAMELPPRARGTGPPTLPQFLNHEVEFTGRLERQLETGKYVLQVDSAKILQ